MLLSPDCIPITRGTFEKYKCLGFPSRDFNLNSLGWDPSSYNSFFFVLSIVDVQCCIRYRCTIQWFTIFKGYTSFIVIIKYWLYFPYCTIKPVLVTYFILRLAPLSPLPLFCLSPFHLSPSNYYRFSISMSLLLFWLDSLVCCIFKFHI